MAGVLGLLLTVFPAQAAIVGPIFKNHSFLPRTLLRGFRKLLGLKIEVEGNLEENERTIYVGNHISNLDGIAMGSKLNASFVAAASVVDMKGIGPVIGSVGTALKTIFIEQTRASLPKDQRYLASNLNGGLNLLFYPEGAMSDGNDVRQFKAGLLSFLFNEKARDGSDLTPLEQKVVLQPLALEVVSVDGVSVKENPDLKYVYIREGDSETRQERGLVGHVWNMMKHKEILLRVTANEVMDPSNYDSNIDLINSAHTSIRQVIAPDNVANDVVVPINKLDLRKQAAQQQTPS